MAWWKKALDLGKQSHFLLNLVLQTACPHPAPQLASVFLPSKWDGVSLLHLSQAQKGHRKAPQMNGSAETHGKAQGGNLGRLQSRGIHKLLRGPPGVTGNTMQHFCSTPWGLHPWSAVDSYPVRGPWGRKSPMQAPAKPEWSGQDMLLSLASSPASLLLLPSRL